MDPLSDVLSLLKPRSYRSGGFDVGGDLAVKFPKHAGIKCYAVVSGQCWLSVEGLPDVVRLTTGDCFLLPRGLPFSLATDLTLTPVDFLTLLSTRPNGSITSHGGGGSCFLVGGHFVLSANHADILLGVLPPIVHIRKESDKMAMRWSLERMMQELREPQPGGFLIAQQLATMMLVQALRLHIAEGQRGGVGWLFALADKQMNAAITSMHDDPAHRWTLQKLAERAGMSRSIFALKFKAMVGKSPMEYLTRWRMLLAGDKLTNSDDPISVIALSLGYESESAFSKAFRRAMGCSPRQHMTWAEFGFPYLQRGRRCPRESACTDRSLMKAMLDHGRYTGCVSKTFYIETFGCQMNAHDSEKVIGTLEQQGYARVQDEDAAGLILYNTCSIRDKAEQKVFHRLNEYKKLQGEGKKFAVLGCVAQQEGEKIFEKAPYVSMVAGSASYRNLPEMLQRLEAGEERITGLDDRQTELTFETEFTARSNPHRGYITIIEGCDKFCAYCVVPYTRGKERSRTAASVMVEAKKMVDLGFTEIQFLGQNVNSYCDPSGRMSFAELLVAVGELPGIRRVRFTTSHPRDFTRDIVQAIDETPTLCDHIHLPVQSGSTAVLKAMAREYTREWYLERMSWIKAAKRDISITSDMIVGFPGETDVDFEETITLVGEVKYDAVFAFKFSPRPNTPAVSMADSIPDEVKSERLRILMDRQREIQRTHYGRHLGEVQEVMVESYNLSRNQVVGRSTQNKTVNFSTAQIVQAQPPIGSYLPVRITQTLPNCLVGEAIADAEEVPIVPVQRASDFVVIN